MTDDRHSRFRCDVKAERQRLSHPEVDLVRAAMNSKTASYPVGKAIWIAEE